MYNGTYLEIVILVGIEVPLMEFSCFNSSKKRGCWQILKVQELKDSINWQCIRRTSGYRAVLTPDAAAEALVGSTCSGTVESKSRSCETFI